MQSAASVIAAYIDELPVLTSQARTVDKPWTFWAAFRHHSRFKKLCPLMQKIFCIPATSAPVERVFSQSTKSTIYTQNPWVKYWNSRIQWVPRRTPKFHILEGTGKKFSALMRRPPPPQTSDQVSANAQDVAKISCLIIYGYFMKNFGKWSNISCSCHLFDHNESRIKCQRLLSKV